MDAALASREVAAEYFVIWSAALLVTPPLFYAVQRTSAYPWIRRRSLDLLQTGRAHRPAVLRRVVDARRHVDRIRALGRAVPRQDGPADPGRAAGAQPYRCCRAADGVAGGGLRVHHRHRPADRCPLWRCRSRHTRPSDRFPGLRRPPRATVLAGLFVFCALLVVRGCSSCPSDRRVAQGSCGDATRNGPPARRIVHVPSGHGARPRRRVAPGERHRLASGLVHRGLRADGGTGDSGCRPGGTSGRRRDARGGVARRGGIPASRAQ